MENRRDDLISFSLNILLHGKDDKFDQIFLQALREQGFGYRFASDVVQDNFGEVNFFVTNISDGNFCPDVVVLKDNSHKFEANFACDGVYLFYNSACIADVNINTKVIPISCGFDERDDVFVSSIKKHKISLAIQRRLKKPGGGFLDSEEICVNTDCDVSDNVYPYICGKIVGMLMQ